MSRPTAYGQVNDVRSVYPYPAAASQPFQANGGKFVLLDVNMSMRATLASGANTLNLIGWAEAGTFSSSSTSGQDIIPVNTAWDAVYEMPINATQNETQLKLLLGKTCDIEKVSGLQYANYDATVDNTLIIVGYKYYGSGTGEQSLLVRLNEKTITHTGV